MNTWSKSTGELKSVSSGYSINIKSEEDISKHYKKGDFPKEGCLTTIFLFFLFVCAILMGYLSYIVLF